MGWPCGLLIEGVLYNMDLCVCVTVSPRLFMYFSAYNSRGIVCICVCLKSLYCTNRGVFA